MTRKKIKKLGFTLIELIVVIAVISLLTSIVISNLNTSRKKAQASKFASDMKQLQNAIYLYINSKRRRRSLFINRACKACSHLAGAAFPGGIQH